MPQHVIERLLAQASYRALILCLYRCSALGPVQQGHLPEQHPRDYVPHEDLILELVFDCNLTLTLREDVQMRPLLPLLDDKFLGQILLRLYIVD